MRVNIAVFASGSGSNAEEIFSYFQDHPSIRVSLVVTNRKEAGVVLRAARYGIPVVHLSRSAMENEQHVTGLLEMHQIFLIALAGYLLKIPDYLIQKFPGRILNIHPSLLPAYGGKGMYGMHVHDAVIRAGEKTSGVTIHVVNEVYDDGEILIQDTVTVEPEDTAESLQKKVLRLEHKHYASVIEWYLKKRLNFS